MLARDGVPFNGVATAGLSNALARLPTVEYEIIERCDLAGAPGARVARELGYSPRQFYRLRRRALRTLARTLVETPSHERAPDEPDDVPTRLGRVLLAGGDGLRRLLDEPAACEVIEHLRTRSAPDADVLSLVRQLGQLSLDDLPEPLHAVAVGTAGGASPRTLAKSLGVSLRQVYRLRRAADAAVWRAFCRQVERCRSAVSCVDVVDAVTDQAIALHQTGESERARHALRAAFGAVDNSTARGALLLQLVDLECAGGDYLAAWSALQAFDRMGGASRSSRAAERDIAAALFEFRSGKRAFYGRLAPALRRLERLEPTGSERARAFALVQGYLIECQTAVLKGTFREATLAADRALDLCNHIDDPQPVLRAKALRAAGVSALLRPGHLADGMRYLRQSYDWCVRGNLRRERVVTAHCMGGAYMLAGDYGRARDQYDQAMRSLEFFTPAVRFVVRIEYIASLLRAGRVAHARAMLETMAGDRSNPFAQALLAVTEAEIELASHAWAAARRGAAAGALACGVSTRLAATARRIEAEALYALGRPMEAASACFEVLEGFSEAADPETTARALQLAAQLTGSTAYRRAAQEIREGLAGALV